jgi:hypothetical protein
MVAAVQGQQTSIFSSHVCNAGTKQSVPPQPSSAQADWLCPAAGRTGRHSLRFTRLIKPSTLSGCVTILQARHDHPSVHQCLLFPNTETVRITIWLTIRFVYCCTPSTTTSRHSSAICTAFRNTHGSERTRGTAPQSGSHMLPQHASQCTSSHTAPPLIAMRMFNCIGAVSTDVDRTYASTRGWANSNAIT